MSDTADGFIPYDDLDPAYRIPIGMTVRHDGPHTWFVEPTETVVIIWVRSESFVGSIALDPTAAEKMAGALRSAAMAVRAV